MATRFYFCTTAANFTADGPSSPANPDIDWVTESPFSTGMMYTTLVDAAYTQVSQSVPGSNFAYVKWQFWSKPLEAQLISGTVDSMMQRCLGGSASSVYFSYHIRVMSNDGATERAELSSGVAFSNYFTTTASSRRLLGAPAAITSYTCVAGDRLLVEMGMGNDAVGAVSASYYLNGVSGNGDLTTTAGSTSSTLNPWFEFSGTITFEATSTNKNQLMMMGVGT